MSDWNKPDNPTVYGSRYDSLYCEQCGAGASGERTCPVCDKLLCADCGRDDLCLSCDDQATHRCGQCGEIAETSPCPVCGQGLCDDCGTICRDCKGD